jgi:hypothetical protein
VAVTPFLLEQLLHDLGRRQGLGVGLGKDILQGLGHTLEAQLTKQLLQLLTRRGFSPRAKKSPATRSRMSRSRRARPNSPY